MCENKVLRRICGLKGVGGSRKLQEIALWGEAS